MPKGLDYIINIKDGNLGGAKKAKTAVDDVDKSVDKLGKSTDGLGSIVGRVGKLMAGAFAISTIISVGADSLQEYQSGFVKASGQVAAALVSTNGVAGRSLDQLRNQANSIEAKTMLSDADVLNAQSLLLTFTNIKGAVFDQAVPAVADLAQRMAGDGPADLKGAAVQVGKALNDPIQGINALRRVGVSFSDAQKNTITALVKTGQTAKAQQLILKELNTEFGGSAEAARKVLGPQGDFKYQIGETKEALGGLISDGLVKVLPAINNFIAATRTGIDWLRENKQMLTNVALGIGLVGGAYLLYQGYLLATQAPLAIVTAAQWALNVAMEANPIGLIVAGIGLLIGGLVIAYKKSETFRASIQGIISVAGLLSDVFIGLGKTIIGALTFNKDLFLSGVKQAASAADEIMNGGIKKRYQEGFNKSIAESRKKAKEEAAQEKADKAARDTASALIGGKPNSLNGKPATGLGSGASADTTTVSTSKQVRNVSVSINKLVEKIEVHTTNLQNASTGEIKRMLSEILTNAVHDSELALG
ncbi:MAG: hypothetical protein IE931_05605 [Sphingobacteriales bacterium]|nr:hypothetical protein [Sphingobacteriales bacterium]